MTQLSGFAEMYRRFAAILRITAMQPPDFPSDMPILMGSIMSYRNAIHALGLEAMEIIELSTNQPPTS